MREKIRVLEKLGIIEEIFHVPIWLMGVRGIRKGEFDLRMISDMRNPNRAIKRQFHQLPTVESIKLKLIGAEVFSLFDLKDAYFHLELAEQSRDLTAFLFEGCIYRYARMPNGVNAAPEIFQKHMERIFKGLNNVTVFIDDILIFTQNREQMTEILVDKQNS